MAQRTKEQDRVYQLSRYRRVRAWMFAFLGGVCAQCSSKKCLQIDHIDNKKGKLSLAKCWGWPRVRLIEELRECQLLCKVCHDTKSIGERGHQRAQHGTYTMYRHYCCRCVACVDAGRAYMRQYLQQRRERQAGIV
jgi:hypothetical protein